MLCYSAKVLYWSEGIKIYLLFKIQLRPISILNPVIDMYNLRRLCWYTRNDILLNHYYKVTFIFQSKSVVFELPLF